MSTNLEDTDNNVEKKEMIEQLTKDQFVQQKYRWVIVVLMGLCFFVNGLGNNTVIPIAHKVSIVYDLSSTYVNAPIAASFLVYSITNFPANYIIDLKGLRISFLIGSGLYSLGIFLCTFVNKAFFFVLLGSILIALGQPFIVNCPAKVATFWFLGKNRTFATSVMIGTNLISIGTSFMMPTIFVSQQSLGNTAKDQIFYLYAAYFLISAITFILVFLFMRAQPKQAPSLGAEVKKSNLKQTIQMLKKDKNLWKFFSAYFLVYGTVIALGSEANLLFKPYGFSDIQIGICAITMLVMGVAGSIVFSIYLKRTGNYKRALRIIVVLSFTIITFLLIWLSVSAAFAITMIIIGFVGFCCTPIIMLCYDLGCQLAFPMGQAQVTGILNGLSLFFTFLTTLIIGSAVGFGQKSDTTVVMIIFMVFLLAGCILFFKVKIFLKRKNLQSGKLNTLDQSRVNDLVKFHHGNHHHNHSQNEEKNIQIEMPQTTRESQNPNFVINDEIVKKQNYVSFIQQKEGL